METALAELKDRLAKLDRPPSRRGSPRLGHAGLHAPRGSADSRDATRDARGGGRTSDSSTTGSGNCSRNSRPTRSPCRTTPTTPRSSGSRRATGIARAACPAELAGEFAQAAVESYRSWVGARENSDFPAFRPSLERIVELRRRCIECYAPYDDAYDVLLEDYEPGMRTSEIREIFAVLRPELPSSSPSSATEEDDAFMRGPFPIPAQDALSRELCEAFGATWDQFRLDPTVHPFEITFGLGDVRLTSRYSERRPTLALHRDARVRPRPVRVGREPGARANTPVRGRARRRCTSPRAGSGRTSSGARCPFWRWFYPRLQESFPGPLASVSLERVPPGGEPRTPDVHPRRRRRDELRPPHHPPLRARAGAPRRSPRGEGSAGRLEHALRGARRASRCPEDALGVLQDAHWSGGGFGYFPTYLLGNVLSVQIWERLRTAIPTIEEQIERGEFAELHTWLRENIYSLGRKLTPAETVERVVGGPIDPEPYLALPRASKLGRSTAA